MSLQECTVDGMPGYKWGEGGKCYPYSRGNIQSEATAKKAARNEGAAKAAIKEEKQELIDDE